MYSTVKVQAFSRQHECYHIGPGHHRFPWAGVGHRRLPLHPCHPTDASITLSLKAVVYFLLLESILRNVQGWMQLQTDHDSLLRCVINPSRPQYPSDFTASPRKYPTRKTSLPPVTSRCHHPSADPPSPDPVRSKLGGRLIRPTYDLVNFFVQ